MKKIFSALLLSVVVLFAVSCDKDSHPEALFHRWVLTNHVCGTQENPMALTFDDDILQVEDACEDVSPFPYGDSRWNYSVDADSVLTIWTFDTYDDNDITETYELPIHLSSDGQYLTLDYVDHHLLGGEDEYSYTFFRR